MKRSLCGAVAILAICLAVPALAADYFEPYPELRPAYPDTWEQPDDSIRFEFGAAYWYSWGGQNAGFTSAFGPVSLDVRDQTHIGELHGKIEDLSTQTYVAGRAGLGFHTTGTYDISPAAAGNIGTNSRIGYAGADFGWLPFGTMTDGFAVGGLVGYHYWKDAPDIGTGQYAVGGNPATLGDAPDDFDIHALRLGVRGTAEFDMFDIQAEAAWIPYAHVTGALGGSAPGGFNFPGVGVPVYENAQTTLSGRGQGVMLEAMAGFHPTENLVIRAGGRAWYLEGNLDAVFNGTAGGVAQPTMTLPSTYASLFRYGLRAELTGKF
ncbi:hypothetical protein ASD04_16815 [Devosia sp. Root436]|jgi:hypothetical protein|uniref:hypothetical protein n=1 Tax=Devosia sp. Root436 TaxID=1736537 RepID=UPI0006F43428|nr:hypothetical protein [Devosia sp. Root436]KQX34301.1 hypothetical protein ASD04_16815 [Devosia sp. Root436]